MIIEGILFLLGVALGIGAALFLAWLFFNKKLRVAHTALQNLEHEKKQLAESAQSSLSQIAVLHERTAQMENIKEELAQSHKLTNDLREKNNDLCVQLAGLKVQNDKASEFFNQRISDLSAVHQNMKEAFASISRDAILKNTDMLNASLKQHLEHFFKVSQKDRTLTQESLASIMTPLKESLISVDKKVQELETKRQGAYVGLKEQIENLLKSQTTLQKETQKLSQAFNAPTIRGRWGEMQLRRVVELSGLSAHCDFVEQQSIKHEDDMVRPDMIVTLPKDKKIVIDAKAPLEFFDNSNDKEEQRGAELASLLRRHLLSLKKKSYHKMLGQSPEFVVMFLPGEAFLHWALLADPSLIDFAAQNEIIIATPITLVALLKAIAFGFNQEAIANNIEDVRRLSQQLIDRVNKVSVHFEKLGKSLKQATQCYNQTLSSLDSRVLVTARKLAEIKSITPEKDSSIKDDMPPIETVPDELGIIANEDM